MSVNPTDLDAPREPISSGADVSHRTTQKSMGPLFKDLYTGVVDVDDPSVVQPLLDNDRRALLDHTTDIQNYAQFQSLHRLPEKWGTSFHHRAYLATVDSLQK